MMIYVLYKAGESIKELGTIKCPAGLAAIIVYTLNEGLRFGRGIDYNLYGMAYERLESGKDVNWDPSFLFLGKLFVEFGIPWQGYVMLMSFVFIVAMLIMLKGFKEIMPLALPLFALFSLSEVENMVRWYMGFSFIMIGISFILNNAPKCKIKFFLFSVIACSFHLALLPIPILFYLVYLKKTPLLTPIPAIILFFCIALFFQSNFMMEFIELFNIFSRTTDRFEGYEDNAQYWLTGGFDGANVSALPDIQVVIFLCCLVYLGHKITITEEEDEEKEDNKGKEDNHKAIFAYNLFIVGFLLYPIANLIELVLRFESIFIFFRAIVLAYILKYIYIEKRITITYGIYILSILIFLNIGRKTLVTPFKMKPEFYMYVWDQDRHTYQSVYDSWLIEIGKGN